MSRLPFILSSSVCVCSCVRVFVWPSTGHLPMGERVLLSTHGIRSSDNLEKSTLAKRGYRSTLRPFTISFIRTIIRIRSTYLIRSTLHVLWRLWYFIPCKLMFGYKLTGLSSQSHLQIELRWIFIVFLRLPSTINLILKRDENHHF